MPSYYRGKKRTTTTTPSALLDLLEDWPRDRPQFLDNTPPRTTTLAPHEDTPKPSVLKEQIMRLKSAKNAKSREESDDGWSIDEEG